MLVETDVHNGRWLVLQQHRVNSATKIPKTEPPIALGEPGKGSRSDISQCQGQVSPFISLIFSDLDQNNFKDTSYIMEQMLWSVVLTQEREAYQTPVPGPPNLRRLSRVGSDLSVAFSPLPPGLASRLCHPLTVEWQHLMTLFSKACLQLHVEHSGPGATGSCIFLKGWRSPRGGTGPRGGRKPGIPVGTAICPGAADCSPGPQPRVAGAAIPVWGGGSGKCGFPPLNTSQGHSSHRIWKGAEPDKLKSPEEDEAKPTASLRKSLSTRGGHGGRSQRRLSGPSWVVISMDEQLLAATIKGLRHHKHDK
ncbi:uncharacterized protein LOC128586798 isoform X1 [Nycticebus coucang]|uniref:uncharacterized protein LOC128586798 isoform X1 n=1 Tax=Nycticebus coucang TaxID=9470 RepID=UPI00234C5129|nr:uncharacterized protein LOC128586798 isoform X1 [Nycticebus coucang]XP_053448889.1 uncharacterized protein LOC128586798 isoform X1 [Nycticebus coucang]XP_053448890.1 uncharacterized protein LOC128586798 isoform X1 [Nycticebus coucang]XP_053448892.1 uncharacterized protein LOC128586798 isoform X1 [Nycticebus coucang]